MCSSQLRHSRRMLSVEAAKQSGALRLVLIDGAMLTNVMIQFNVGIRIA